MISSGLALSLAAMMLMHPAPKAPPPDPYGQSYIGIYMEALQGFVRVTNFTPTSPANKAGMKIGDIVVKVDGNPVASLDQTSPLIRRVRPGNVVELEIKRGDETITLKIRTIVRPVDLAP